MMSPATEAEIEIVSLTAVGGMEQETSDETAFELISLTIIVEFETYRAMPSGTTRILSSMASPAKLPMAVIYEN